MVTRVIETYVSLVQTTAGAIIVTSLSLLICAAIVLWARRSSFEQHWPVFAAACTMTGLLIGVYAFAVAAGKWQGEYFRTPLIVQVAMLLPLSLAAWGAWLTLYGWLATHSRHPLLLYTLAACLLIPLVVMADQAEISGGLVLVGPDGETWVDAVVAVGLILIPVFVFEGIRRGLAQDMLP
jgi:hypothetical protein